MDHIAVQTDDFDFAAEYAALRAAAPAIGAIATFSGLMRDFNSNCETHSSDHATPADQISHLFLEHYPGMTEKVLQQLVQDARQRWQLQEVRLVHRIGSFLPGDQIVFVGVSSAHRKDAFAACQFLMDILKTQAPFWKKEVTDQGERWVDARDSDSRAAQHWYSAKP